ncbi:hypothetical protein BDZ91DRAFT_356694 [Kalaharituber pfeilii]|nr:hypothetical protein BDZ91DRAFT_356694 [Kalaharituber pfeilii]
MRVLSADDKKSGNWTAAHSRRASLQLPDISLSPEDHHNLRRLNMRPPTGIGTVEAVLTRLQEPETFVLFEAFVKSFPCAHCLRDNLPAPIAAAPRKQLLTTNLPTSFTGTLFGPKLGPWRVSLSEKAFEDIRSASKEGHSTMIANKLSALASGHWDTESLRRPLSKDLLEAVQEKEKVPLWTAVYGVDGRILWQVNVGFDEEVDSNCQMITVWRIGNQDEVEKTVRDVLILQKSYTISQVQERRVRIRDFPVLPKTCSRVDHARRRSVQLREAYETVLEELDEASLKEPDEAVLEAQEALMSNKFYCVSGKVLDRLFASYNSVEFPFDISMEETEIIKHSNTAAFIQGRSGTGKTSCLLFKLLCRNIASREHEGTSVRQIFLTRSSYLAERLKEYLQRLLNSQLGILSAPVKPDLPQAQEYTIKEAKDPLENLTLDNITEDKFPLVCTFGQLFNFLERAIRYNDRKDFTSLTSHANTADAGRVSRLIDYKAFRTQYWRKHFYGHRRQFEPELVFSEIIGTIKGSTSAHRSFEPLSREDYVSLSQRKAPVFTEASDRYVIYELYRDYERNKTVLGHQDDIDRVTYLLKSLEKDQHLKRRVQSLFDEVYVDELQDNRLLELDLLLTLVRSPNGIHFAGDTAQCISRDNTFRFQDVKLRFYEHFKDMANEARKPSWARPELFQLATNYRSHQGILSLAADIVEMLCNAFPSQIDSLPREVGNYPGAMPTVFVGFDHQILAQGGAGMMGTEEGLGCFGAEQAILVRDEDAQTELRALLPSTTILTIFESKGLEFEDVILYNFFRNTVWANVGVHVLKQLLQKGAADELDTGKYGMLCSELKHLYVAVTRARKNLWIVESDPASVQNILTVWTMTGKESGRNPIVSIVDANEIDAQQKARNIIKPGKSTTPDAWRKQGEMFLHRDLYQEALRCFRRAGHRQGQALANAFLKYQDAQALDIAPDTLSMEARELYEQAATLFEEGSFIDKAAEAWAAMENYKKAAQVLQADKNYGKAARYYEKAEEFLQAGTCYDLAGQYDDAVRVYRKGEHFTELIEYLGRRQQRISNDVRTRYSTLVNILLQRGDLQLPDNMMSVAVDTLGDDDKKEKFYKDFNRTEDLLEFYRRKKRYHETFMLALSEGKFQYAVRLAEEPGASTAGRELSIPLDDILTLFNGLMAGNTWSSVGINIQTVSQSTATSSLGLGTVMADDLSSTKYTALALNKSQSRWKQILACVAAAGTGFKLARPDASASFSNFLGEIETNFLDLAISRSCPLLP